MLYLVPPYMLVKKLSHITFWSGYNLGHHLDGSLSSSVEYRGAGYYRYTEPINHSQPQNPNYGSSSQSYQHTSSDYASILFAHHQFPYPLNAFNNQEDNDDEIEPLRHSMWH